jgi:hypothetical protein
MISFYRAELRLPLFIRKSPFGPPVYEWVLAKILRKKIIYDFDDAIWLTDANRNPGL